MADPKLPKQLSEASILDEFTQTGNIYVDPAFTSQEVIDTEFDGKSPVTGEALVFGVNAFADLDSAHTVPVAPEADHAAIVTDVHRGLTDGHHMFFGTAAAGSVPGRAYDVYVVDGQAYNFCVVPRTTANYTADPDGTVSLYIEGSTVASNLVPLGAQTGTTLTGDLEITIKNSRAMYVSLGDGSGWAADRDNAGDHRFGTITGSMDFYLTGFTVGSQFAIHRGQIKGAGGEKAHVVGLVENSYFNNAFMGIHMGHNSNGNSWSSWADIDLTITGSSIHDAFMLLPNVSSATRMGNGELTLHGDINLKITGSTMNGLVIGTGLDGTGWRRNGWVDGNITFHVTASTTGTSFVTKGNVGAKDDFKTVIGVIDGKSVVGNFVVYEVRDSESRDKVYANTTITVTDSTMGKFTFLTEINSSGNTITSLTNQLHGAQKLEVTGSSMGDVISSASAQDATFDLVFHASETQSVVGTINTWNTLTVDAGASVRAAGLTSVESVTLNGANILSAGSITGVTLLSVEDASLTKGDVILVSGLSSFSEGNIDTVLVNGDEFSYGMFGGQYEYVGGNLVAHLDPTYLVNNNYSGNGVNTGFSGVKGYKDLSAAQTAAKTSGASVIFTNKDDTVDAPAFTANINTLDLNTKFVGRDGTPLSLDGVSVIIGGDTAVESANVAFSNVTYIDTVKIGNVTGAVTAAIGTAVSSEVQIGDDFVTVPGIKTIDLTTGSAADAEITVTGSVIDSIRAATQDITGVLNVTASTIGAIYGGESKVLLQGSGNEVTTVYAENDGSAIKLGNSNVSNYVAGFSSVKDAHAVTYNDGVSATNLILGDATVTKDAESGEFVITGLANTITQIDANITGGNIQNLYIGAKGNVITGDVNLTTAGSFGNIIFDDSVGAGKFNLTLTGGTAISFLNGVPTPGPDAQVEEDGMVNPGLNDDAVFYGIVYGGSFSVLDGAVYDKEDPEKIDRVVGNKLVVDGNAKAGSVKNFKSLEVTGGTLNVAGGDRKSELGAENVLDISGDITNKRAIQAGAIKAQNLDNAGLIGTLRAGAKAEENPGIVLTGNLKNTGYIKSSTITVPGTFENTGKITVTGDITAGSVFTNSGELFFRSTVDDNALGTFHQIGGLSLTAGTDVTNTGFISAGYLTGVKNLTTSKMYVTGGAEITGNITITAGSEVAFTSKAMIPEEDGSTTRNELLARFQDAATGDLLPGLILGGSITIADTANLVVSGILNTKGTKTITITATEGGLVGSNEIVRSEGGLNSWTINWGEGLAAGDYGMVRTDTAITIYSHDELLVNSGYLDKGYEEGDAINVGGKTYLYGLNIFGSVEDAVIFAQTHADAKNAKIRIFNDSVGEVDATGYDLIVDNSTVGAVTAKSIKVVSDSTIGSVESADSLTIDSSARLTLAGTLAEGTKLVVDASEGSGSRMVLVVSEGVVIDPAAVDVLAPAGKVYTAYVLPGEGEEAPANAGNLFIQSTDNIYFVASVEGLVSGQSFDSATRDALFLGENVFTDRAQAEAAALASGGNLFVVGFNADSEEVKKSEGINTVFELVSGGSATITGQGELQFEGGSLSTYVYGQDLKYEDATGNVTFIADKTRSSTRMYITGNDYENVTTGNVTARITDSTASRVYIGAGSFGLDEDKPIKIDVLIQGSSIGGFYGIETKTTADNYNIPTERVDPNPDNKQIINADIDIKIYDTVVGGTFTVLNTNNAHWNGHGATLLQTYYTAGSINVEMGNARLTDNIRVGISLEGAGKAVQANNVPNTLHIVATDKGSTTYASYLCEWDTIIVDATAKLELNTLQYSTIAMGPRDSAGTKDLDGYGTMTQLMINMSGYKSGTHTVIQASGQIFTDFDNTGTLIGSNITVIGDNDMANRCKLSYDTQGDGENAQLKKIVIFDKADDMYVNTGYTTSVNGTIVGTNQQELLFGSNAHKDFTTALLYADEWHGSIIVTGGSFESQDFHGNNVELQNGAKITALSMGNETGEGGRRWTDAVLKVGEGATIGSADGSSGILNSSVLEINGLATIGDVSNFSAITVKKGLDLAMGDVVGANLSMYADSEIQAKSFSFNDALTTNFAVDVTGYTGRSHTLISTENGITGTPKVEIVTTDKYSKKPTDPTKYEVKTVGNDLVLVYKNPNDTFLNSEYSETTLAGGVVLDDGTYLEYGRNAFSDATAAAQALGGEKYTLTVTGGEIAGDIMLGGSSFVMEAGTVNGVVYACTDTLENNNLYSGKTYTVNGGTIGGIDLTAGDGIYTAKKSAIEFGKNVTVTGNVIGAGDTKLALGSGTATVGIIKGVSAVTINADGFLKASGIDLGGGTITVKQAAFETGVGNYRLLVDSDTAILNATVTADAGVGIYKSERQIYAIDKSRIYFDPNFNETDTDGTYVGDDLLVWNVNAFNNFQNAVSAARESGGTLYISHGGGTVSITGTPVVNLNIVDSTIPTIQQGMDGGDTTNGDISVVIKGSSFGANDGYIGSYGAWNSRNNLNGTLYVDVSDSTVGGGLLRIGTFFNAGNKKLDINFTDTEIRGDMRIIEDSTMNSTDTVTVNMTGVTAPVTKWWTFFSGYPGNAGSPLNGTITVNIKDSVLGDGGNGFRFALQRDNGTSNVFGENMNVTFSVENTTVNGGLLVEHIEGQNITFNGQSTLVVKGENYVRYALMFNTLDIDGDAYITGSTMSFRTGLVKVNAADYDGPTKTLAWFTNSIQNLAGVSEETTLKDGYFVTWGSKGIVLSDGSVGNLYYNSTYTTAVTGDKSAAGDVLIFVEDAEKVERRAAANALIDFEEAKKSLTSGNKLFAAVNEELFGEETNAVYATINDEEVSKTPFVNLVITSGDFTKTKTGYDEETGEEITLSPTLAVAGKGKTVTGNASIEIAGGSFGKAAVTHEEDDGEGGTIVVVDSPEVIAVIDGTKSQVNGGKSSLLVSKASDMYATIKGFTDMTVGANITVRDDIVDVDSLTIDATAGGFLTAKKGLGVNSITIDATGFDGSSKKVLSSDALAGFTGTINVIGENVDYYSNGKDSLYLVSEGLGNVYFCSSWDPSISGQEYEPTGELLMFGVNAFDNVTADVLKTRTSSDYTAYILDGDFSAADLDLTSVGQVNLQVEGGKFANVKLADGSDVKISASTAAVSFASIAGTGAEESTGYSLTVDPAGEFAATVTAASGVSAFTFGAADAAAGKVSVGTVDYLVNGGNLTVDFAGYTIGDVATATLLNATINNFIQYETPEEGEPYSRTVVSSVNNADKLMPYYDENGKKIVVAKRGNAGFLSADADDSVNGTVEVVDGVTNTKVYGYNVSTSLSAVSGQLSDGDTLVINGVDRRDLNSNVNPYLNIIATDSTLGAVRLGATATNDNDFKRIGNGSETFTNVTFTDAHDVYLLGRGNGADSRLIVVAGTVEEGSIVDGTYTIKFTGGGHTNTGGNGQFRAVQNAKIGGGVMDVTFQDYRMNGDVELFDNVYGYEGQLKELKVTLNNVVSPAAKYIRFWDPADANSTKITMTITNSYFGGGTDATLGIFGDGTTTNWTGEATVTISGFTATGTLSGARGLGRYGGDGVDSVTEGKRILKVVKNDEDHDNNVNLVKMFSEIQVDDNALLTGSTVSLSETNTGFVLLGEEGKDYGTFKEFVKVSSITNSADLSAKLVNKADGETELGVYTAVVGATNVFIYKQGSLGDVFYSTQYSKSIDGLTVDTGAGSTTILVYGDNAVSKLEDAYAALDLAGAEVGFHVEGANDTAIYAKGHRTVFDGGTVKDIFAGDTAAAVTGADITVNKLATVTNITVSAEDAKVTGDAKITIGADAVVSGTIDAGDNATSSLEFKGAGKAGAIVGFNTVTVKASDVVTVTNDASAKTITIDATDFVDFDKIVMTAKSFADGTTVTVTGAEGYTGYIADIEGGKAVVISTGLVKDTYADASWTETTPLGFDGETALSFGVNAFNSAAEAAAKVAEGYTLYIKSGAFSAEEAVTLGEKRNAVVEGDAAIGAFTAQADEEGKNSGTLTVDGTLSAASISGVSALNLNAGQNVITVDGAVTLAAEGALTIAVSADYVQEASDIVVLATGAEGGIFIGETELADRTAITLTGAGTGSYYAYYDAASKDVHMLRLDTFYLDSGWWDNPGAVPAVHPITSEPLFYNKNAFGSMNSLGTNLRDGNKMWATNRNGSVHTGGPADSAPKLANDGSGDGAFLSEVHVVNSNVDQIVIGGTTGERVYVGDTTVSIENSSIATNNDLESWLVSNVTADQPWSHRNTLFGSVTVDVTNSTIGNAANPSGDNAVRILNFTNVVNRSEEEKAVVNVNFSTTSIYRAIRFLGDSPMGKDVVRENFSTSPLVDDGGIGTVEEYNINLDTVTVGGDVRWAIRGGGARDQITGGVVTVNMKNTTFGDQAVFAIEDDWNEGNGIDNDMPKNGTDFVFNLESSTINGYLVAGRRSYDSALADLSVNADGNGYSGARVLNVNGINYVKNALFFKEINLTGDSSLQGETVKLFNGNDLNGHVDGIIKIDLTGYEGGSRVLLDLDATYDDEGKLVSGGISNFDWNKNLVVLGNEIPEGEEQPKYVLRSDYDSDSKTVSKIVLTGVVKDVYVSSAYNPDDFGDLGLTYKPTGEALFFGYNAFNAMADQKDPDTEEVIPGALTALQQKGTILHVTGVVQATELLDNSITIDAGAMLLYKGSEAIIVDGDVHVDANGTFAIDGKNLTSSGESRILVLSADTIDGSITVSAPAYSTEIVEEEGKQNLYLVLLADEVYINQEWRGYEPETEIVIDGKTIYYGLTAFDDTQALTALDKVSPKGTINVVGSTVTFDTTAVEKKDGVNLIVDSTSEIVKSSIGYTNTATLTLKEGAVARGISVGKGSEVTVAAGALVTEGFYLNAEASATFAEGSTLDFYMVGQKTTEGARVTNLSAVTGLPSYTATIDSGIAVGTYEIATGAATFDGSIVLQTSEKVFDVDALTVGNRVKVNELGSYFELGITGNGTLTMTVEASQDILYVNSTWTEGQTYKVDGKDVTVGVNGFLNGDDAVAKAGDVGATTIKVVGGSASFTGGVTSLITIVRNATLFDTNVSGTLTVEDTATLTGKSEFAEGAAITINGTVAFDTALTSEGAQIKGLSVATFGETTKFTLNIAGTVAEGDSFLLATGVADSFAGTVFTVGNNLELTVNGGVVNVGELGYKLVLDETGALTFAVSAKSVLEIAYVNSTWGGLEDGTPVTLSDEVTTATIGVDAFDSYSKAVNFGTKSVLVDGGVVTFGSGTSVATTVGAGATLVGINQFNQSITVDGTVAFDTQYATATGAQFVNFNYVTSSEGKSITYTLNDTKKAANVYLLADGLTAFDSTVDFNGVTLTVGTTVEDIEGFDYTLNFAEGKLSLDVKAHDTPLPTPELVYMNSEWSTIADGEPVTYGEQTLTKGYNAFDNLKAAEAGTLTTVEVVGGAVSFDEGFSKTVTVDVEATVVGKAAFTAAITIDGTFLFDTTVATATDAQLTGYSFVSAGAKFALSDSVGGEEDKTYILATDAASFNKAITVNETSDITLEQGATVNGYDYAIAIDGDSNLVLTVKKYVKPTDLPDHVYVDVTWTGEAGTEVTLSDGVTKATLGTDAFNNYNDAVNGVADEGLITIDGNEISFPSSVAAGVTTEVGVNAALTGKSAFDKAITVKGLILFSAAYAGADEANAQISGYGNIAVTSDTYYQLSALTFGKGTYFLASGLTGTFDGSVLLLTGTEEQYYLTVSGGAVEFGDYTYQLGYTDNSALTLTIADKPTPPPEKPEQAYMNSEWASIADGQPVTYGEKTLTKGYDAFDNLADAEAAETTTNKVEVVGGYVSFAGSSFSKTITVDAEATVVGTATFTTAITIDGTVAFSTEFATATAAQFGGFSYVGGSTKYTFTVAGSTVVADGDVYLLASGLDTFTDSISFNGQSLTVGGEGVTVGEFVFTLGFTDNNVLAVNVKKSQGPTPPPPPTSTVYVNSEWSEIADGQPVTFINSEGETVTATKGVDAFATADEAVAHVTDDGAIEIVGGEVAFSGPIAEAVTVDPTATLTGKVTFAEGGSLTVNGTILFDTTVSTDAPQIASFDDNVVLGETAKLSVKIAPAAAGTTPVVLATEASDLFKQSVESEGFTFVVGAPDFQVANVEGKEVSYVLDLDDDDNLVLSYVALANAADNSWNDTLKNNPQIGNLEVNMIDEFDRLLLDEKGTILKDGNYNFVGGTDKADYGQIVMSSAGMIRFSVTPKASDPKDKVKISLVSYDPSTGKTKVLKSATSTKDNVATTAKYYLDPIHDEKASKLQYYVAVENKGKTEVFYNVDLTSDSVFFVDGDDNANNWLVKSKAINQNILDPDEFADTPISLDSGSTAIQMDVDQFEIGDVDGYNWVGFGDNADVARISPSAPAVLNIKLDGVVATGAVAGSLKLVVYKTSLTSKGWKQTAVKTKTVNLKSKNGVETGLLYLDRLVADVNDKEGLTGYYVMVQSTNAKKGGEAYYTVTATGNVYNDADASIKNETGNGWLLNSKTKQLNSNLVIGGEITGTSKETATEIALDNDGTSEADWANFVGFGDVYDYAEIVISEAGTYQFSVATNAGNSKFVVYQLTQKAGKTTWTSKTLGSVTIKGASPDAELKKDLKITEATSANVRYFVSMQTSDQKKSPEVYYNVSAWRTDASSSASLDLSQDLFASQDSFADASAYLADSQLIDDKQSWQSVASLA